MLGGEWVLLEISFYRDVRWFWVNCGERQIFLSISAEQLLTHSKRWLWRLKSLLCMSHRELESAWRDFLKKNELRWILPRIRVISRCVRLRKFPTILLKIALRTHFLGDLADSLFLEVVCTCHNLPLAPIWVISDTGLCLVRFLEKYRTPLTPSVSAVDEISDDLT